MENTKSIPSPRCAIKLSAFVYLSALEKKGTINLNTDNLENIKRFIHKLLEKISSLSINAAPLVMTSRQINVVDKGMMYNFNYSQEIPKRIELNSSSIVTNKNLIQIPYLEEDSSYTETIFPTRIGALEYVLDSAPFSSNYIHNISLPYMPDNYSGDILQDAKEFSCLHLCGTSLSNSDIETKNQTYLTLGSSQYIKFFDKVVDCMDIIISGGNMTSVLRDFDSIADIKTIIIKNMDLSLRDEIGFSVNNETFPSLEIQINYDALETDLKQLGYQNSSIDKLNETLTTNLANLLTTNVKKLIWRYISIADSNKSRIDAFLQIAQQEYGRVYSDEEKNVFEDMAAKSEDFKYLIPGLISPNGVFGDVIVVDNGVSADGKKNLKSYKTNLVKFAGSTHVIDKACEEAIHIKAHFGFTNLITGNLRDIEYNISEIESGEEIANFSLAAQNENKPYFHTTNYVTQMYKNSIIAIDEADKGGDGSQLKNIQENIKPAFRVGVTGTVTNGTVKRAFEMMPTENKINMSNFDIYLSSYEINSESAIAIVKNIGDNLILATLFDVAKIVLDPTQSKKKDTVDLYALSLSAASRILDYANEVGLVSFSDIDSIDMANTIMQLVNSVRTSIIEQKKYTYSEFLSYKRDVFLKAIFSLGTINVGTISPHLFAKAYAANMRENSTVVSLVAREQLTQKAETVIFDPVLARPNNEDESNYQQVRTFFDILINHAYVGTTKINKVNKLLDENFRLFIKTFIGPKVNEKNIGKLYDRLIEEQYSEITQMGIVDIKGFKSVLQKDLSQINLSEIYKAFMQNNFDADSPNVTKFAQSKGRINKNYIFFKAILPHYSMFLNNVYAESEFYNIDAINNQRIAEGVNFFDNVSFDSDTKPNRIGDASPEYVTTFQVDLFSLLPKTQCEKMALRKLGLKLRFS